METITIKFIKRIVLKTSHLYEYRSTKQHENYSFRLLVTEPIEGCLLKTVEIDIKYFEDHSFEFIAFRKKNPVKKSIFNGEKVFALKSSGLFIFHDPVSDNYYKTKHLSLLNIWDLHYPILEEGYQYNGVEIHYLSKAEIKQLSI